MPISLAAAALALQLASGATLADVLPILVAHGERYAAALPSLACEETAISQQLKKSAIKEEVRIQATLQVQRTADPQRPFNETYRWNTRNGLPVDPAKNLHAPYFVAGAFSNGLGFSSPRRIACFDITLEPQTPNLILTLHRKPGVNLPPDCALVAEGLISRITIDPATTHVTRVERTIPGDEAERRKEPFFAAIDYAPVTLGDEIFWLPTRAEMHDAKDERRMQATYRDCRRFTTSMRIVGGVSALPER